MIKEALSSNKMMNALHDVALRSFRRGAPTIEEAIADTHKTISGVSGKKSMMEHFKALNVDRVTKRRLGVNPVTNTPFSGKLQKFPSVKQMSGEQLTTLEQMNKTSSFPANVLVGSGLGALGGYLIGPDDKKKSSALQGAFWGGFSSVIPEMMVAKTKKLPVMAALRKVSIGDAAKAAAGVTGFTAVANKITGAYDPNKKKKNNILTTLAPGLDDAAMMGMAFAKAI
jgi:hypothetical protein